MLESSVSAKGLRLARMAVASLCVCISLVCAQSAWTQAAPGPIELLPYEEAFITEAWKDLLQPTANQIADWTGWQGSAWVSPHAYDGHIGTDFALETGTPLFAVASGTVVEVVNQYPEGDHSTYYGNYVKIALDGTSPQGESLDAYYGHMLPTIQVSVGQHLTAGQLVGQSDNTGNSTSEHIHLETRVRSTGEQQCPFYYGLFKYPVMFNANVNRQVGHVIRVTAASTAVRTDRFASSSVITTAYQNQAFFACYWQRGYYCVFIPNNTSYRTGWIRAIDATEVFEGTVIQALPDAGAYVHTGTLAAPLAIRSTPDAGGAVVGQIVYGGGRFVADQVQSGWYRIAVPGSATWGWVQPNARMVVYPQLYNPALNLANRPSNDFPVSEAFSTVGRCLFATSKFNRSEVKTFSPASPGGDGKALFMTDSTNTGNGVCESVIYGKADSRDYFVQADCYFNYQSLSDGYEVYGIFARDDGFAGIDQTFEGKGNCYAILYDTSTGRVQAGRIVDSVVTDLQAKRKFVTADGWHKLRIECKGDVIKFYMDGVLLKQATDTTFPSGPCGLSYSFHKRKTWVAGRGCYFDNFSGGGL
jgi:murein DD-endopeptidase MepM/ murein hydrolase activator NlpD